MTHVLKALVLVLLVVSGSHAEEHRVNPETDFKALCPKVNAGDSIVLENGVWRDIELEFDSLSGTENAPVTIVAETSGEVVFSGKTKFRISGQYIVVSGFIFRDCFDIDHVFQMKSRKHVFAHHCRVTQCIFEQPTKVDSSKDTKWLSIYGSNNRIDHCYFDGKTTQGTTLVVWVDKDLLGKHRIDHNYFGPRPKLGQNGGETIRIGTSKVSESLCQTIVEDNYFYHCDGEAEIISNKSCENIYRHNVFEEYSGALTLRHGHRCLVDGNVFLGNELPGTGGVRIIGQGHRVINNYFEGLRGNNVRCAISLMNGIPDGPLNGYAPVKDAFIAHNTLIDCKVTIGIGVGAGSRNRTIAPKDCLFANNVVSSGQWNPFAIHADPKGVAWKGNRQQTGKKYPDSPVEFDRVELQLQRGDDALMRPTDPRKLQTKALTALVVKTDVDGEPRGKVAFAGCDEPKTKLRKFASPSNTGPDWWRKSD